MKKPASGARNAGAPWPIKRAWAGAASFAELVPLLPPDYQPLLMALVDENNELLFRVRRRARQNHVMLKRSVELMQQVMNSLSPPEGSSGDTHQTRLRMRPRAARPAPKEAGVKV